MDDFNSTTVLLDLRDRMARMETKLDGHFEAHLAIDARFEKIEARIELQDGRLATCANDIAANKTRYATLAAVASAILAVLSLFGDNLWTLISAT